MSNTKTEAQRLADDLENDLFADDGTSLSRRSQAIADDAAAELRRLDAIEHRHNEMMANPCQEWDNKAYMQAIANLRAQLSKAVAEEREACAKVHDRIDLEYEGEDVQATWCAAAIRARSNT